MKRINIKFRLSFFDSCAIRKFFVNIVIQTTLREENRLRVFGNRVLRIFGPKREENGSCIKLHNDKLYSLYSTNIVRVL
jgi:hypothetical protein